VRFSKIHVLILLLLLACVNSFAKERVNEIKVFYFDQGSSKLRLDKHNNQDALDSLVTLVNRIQKSGRTKVDTLFITGGASPEGNMGFNDQLSRERAAQLESALRSRVSFTGVALIVKDLGENWGFLDTLVRKGNHPSKDKILDIIRNTPVYVRENGMIVTGRKKQLMDLEGGKVWNDLLKSYFPPTRHTVVYMSYLTPIDQHDQLLVKPAADTIKTEFFQPAQPYELSTFERKYGFVIKTNLLFDLATLINLEVEFPIGDRWSIAGEFISPWWHLPDKNITIDMQHAGLEGKYWLGNRERRSILTGFYTGVHVGAGQYDFQLGGDGTGIQGETMLQAGLSFGYAHRISNRFRLEYGLGVGYIRSNYRKYMPVYDTPQYGDIKVIEYPWEEETLSWIGPTKLKVSLVFMIGGTRRK